MATYQLQDGSYGLVTPAGAYMAASGGMAAPACQLLLKLLSQEQTPQLKLPQLSQWSGMPESDTLELLYHLQSLALLSAVTSPIAAPQGSLESALPARLRALSNRERVLLADSQGLCILTLGFAHETAEELSGMSATLLGLSARHEKLLTRHMGLQAPQWALVGADGCSKLGFWRLQIGEQRFSLVIEGVPHLNQLAFTEVIWCLAKRYLRRDGE